MVYLISRLILRPLFLLIFRPHVVGRENVPATGPFIIASNHLSFIDSMAIPLMSPRRVGYLAKAEYFTGTGIKGWLTKTWFTALGALPVERQTHRAAQEALDMGLVNTVVPLERLEEETVAWARELLERSPLALRMLKGALTAVTDGAAGMQQFAGDATLLFYMSEEAQEGRDAFREKRRPDFARFPRRP